MTTTTIAIEDVLSVYSGKPGACCCGCAGSHRYASATREEAGRDRGYPVMDDEVNDKQVRRVVRLLNQAAEDGLLVDGRSGEYCSAEINGRLYVAYLRGAK